MSKAFKPGKAVKPKKKCCKSRPRCKRCRVTLERLADRGLAQRREDGRFLIVQVVPKREQKAARRT